MPVPRFLVAALLAILLAAAGPAPSRSAGGEASPALTGPERPAPPALTGPLARLPLAFSPGPAGSDGLPTFHASGAGYAAVLAPGGEATVRLAREGAPRELRMGVAGATARPAGEGRGLLPGRTNYLIGDDMEQWRTGVARYGTVVYADVYPGVDLVYHGNAQHLEYDFVVDPGVDPSVIDVVLGGTGEPAIDEDGDLRLGPDLSMAKPVIYQDIGGSRRRVDGSFVLGAPGHVGFEVGPYDAGHPLVIDPVLVTSTYLGGTGIDSSYGVAADRSGNVYLTGYTESADFQTVNPLQPALTEGPGVRTDAFVAKLNPAGTDLVYATYFGGGDRDTGRAIAVGPDGAVYVAGTTESPDFPTTRPVQPSFGGGTSDAFLAKLTADGSAVDYATTIGGSAVEEGNGLAVDGAGNAFLTGATTSTNFPTAGPVQATLGGETDAFVTKVAAGGSSLAYSTYLGGATDEHGLAVALDRAGEAHVTGDTSSPNFPTVRPFQPRYGGIGDQAGRGPDVAGDAFVTHLDDRGSALVYSTYLGGNDSDSGAGIAVDPDGTAFVTGSTGSANFPLAEPRQSTKAGDFDAFVTAVDQSGTELVYSTFLGGGSADGAAAVAVDPEGRAAVVGATSSSDFPMADAFQKSKGGGFVDGFVTALSSNGSELELSSYVGGGDEDQATGVAIDGEGSLHITGYTNSGNFPTAQPLRAQKTGAVGDAFVTAIADPGLAGEATSSSRDNRLRLLLATTIALLLAAVLVTLWLRRHPDPAQAGPLAELPPQPRREQPAPPVPAQGGISPRPRPAPPGPERPRAGDPGPERPVRAGDPGPERPVRAGDPGPERPVRAGDPGPGPPVPAGRPPARTGRPPSAGPGGEDPFARLPPPAARRPAPPRVQRPPTTPRSAPDPRAPFTPPGGVVPLPPIAAPTSRPDRPAAGDRPQGPFTPPGGVVPEPSFLRADPVLRTPPTPPTPPTPAPGPPPPPARAEPPASPPQVPVPDILGPSGPVRAGDPGPSGPVGAGDPGPSGPVRAGDPGPSGPVGAEDPVPPEMEVPPPASEPEVPSPAGTSATEPPSADVSVPDLLPPEEPPAELSGPVDVSNPDLLWETTEPPPPPPVDVSAPDLWETAEPVPDLGTEELAAWELLISSPVPTDFSEQEAPATSTSNGADDAVPAPSPGEPVPDLWAEDLPITPSSEPGSGDEWLRLLWSEDLPLPELDEDAETPSQPEPPESPKGSEPGDRP